jgi:hypothetical protein
VGQQSELHITGSAIKNRQHKGTSLLGQKDVWSWQSKPKRKPLPRRRFAPNATTADPGTGNGDASSDQKEYGSEVYHWLTQGQRFGLS